MANKNNFMSGHMASFALATLALCMIGLNEQLLNPGSILAAPKAPTKLTSTLVAWISSQSEQIVEEMEAIVKQQVETNQFSVVYYLRYLNLFESLKVVSSNEHVDKFGWVAKKVRAFSRVYGSISDIVSAYMKDLDTRMLEIESKEKKGKQEAPNKEWVTIYETLNYVATHAPKVQHNGANLAQEASDLLDKSPNGTADKKRSTRYLLYRRAFN